MKKSQRNTSSTLTNTKSKIKIIHAFLLLLTTFHSPMLASNDAIEASAAVLNQIMEPFTTNYSINMGTMSYIEQQTLHSMIEMSSVITLGRSLRIGGKLNLAPAASSDPDMLHVVGGIIFGYKGIQSPFTASYYDVALGGGTTQNGSGFFMLEPIYGALLYKSRNLRLFRTKHTFGIAARAAYRFNIEQDGRLQNNLGINGLSLGLSINLSSARITDYR